MAFALLLATALAIVGLIATTAQGFVTSHRLVEAAPVARILVELMPDEPEAAGLCALMILHHARRDARSRRSRLPRDNRGRAEARRA